jgi:imidazolonepropionase
MDLSITFLGAHAIAPEYSDDPQGYTDLVSETMLPIVCQWWETHAPRLPLPFVDVFCENKAFHPGAIASDPDQGLLAGIPAQDPRRRVRQPGRRIACGRAWGGLSRPSGQDLRADIAALGSSDTVAVSLPCTPFGLAESEYTPAQKILDADGILALATDCNPGTAWNESMQFVIALACRYMGLTPAQAIAASTINSAHAIRRADVIGSLEVGKQADLLVLSVPDYRHLGYRFGTNLVKQVIKRGRVYSVDVGYYRTA